MEILFCFLVSDPIIVGLRPSLTEGFLKPKNVSQTLFSTRFRVFYTRSRTELGSLFSEYLRSFGERYLDPFFSSRGIVPIFYGVATFGEKNQEDISSHLSTFHTEMGPFF